ncbi:MAG: hypothetical protein ACYCX4_08840 [Bacillota bacterium]
MDYISTEINDTLATLSDYLLKLVPALKKCANYYQSGQSLEGSKMLIDMIEGVSWVISIASANKKLNSVNIEEINLKLKEIVNAFEYEDYILVGDLLEYETLPIMQKLLNIMEYAHEEQ